MTVETTLNPDGSANLIVNGRVEVSNESVQVVDNIAWALRNSNNGGVCDVSEADEIAASIKGEKMCNGWKNRATWNVALWIGNDEGLYNMARDYARYEEPYKQMVAELRMLGTTETPDGVAYNDSNLDFLALDIMIRELVVDDVHIDDLTRLMVENPPSAIWNH